MRVNSIISVGCRVEGSYGPLVANSNPTIKQRVRSRAVGTVISAADRHKWQVRFDYSNEIRTVPSNGLTIVPADTGIPLDEVTTSSNSATQTVASSTVSNSDPIEPADEDAIVEAGDDENSVQDEEADGGTNLQLAPNNDFCFTEEDFLRVSNEMNDATRHQGRFIDAWKKSKSSKDTKKFAHQAQMGKSYGRL